MIHYKKSHSPRKCSLEKAQLPLPGRGLPISIRNQSAARSSFRSVRPRVRRREFRRCTKRGTCTGVADERVGTSQKRARKGQFAWFSIRNDPAPILKNALRQPKQKRQTYDPFGKNKCWANGRPSRDEGLAALSQLPVTVTLFRRVFFFFFHAYTMSDLRTFRQTYVHHVRKECSLEISVQWRRSSSSTSSTVTHFFLHFLCVFHPLISVLLGLRKTRNQI